MEVRNCKVCGKMFYYSNNPICPQCLAKDEENFNKVRDFLKEFPGSKIYDVVEYTGVSAKRIYRYLREGRIEVLDENQDFLTCMRCGEPIKTGKYCSECYKQFKDKVDKMYTVKEDVEVNPMMRFIFRDK